MGPRAHAVARVDHKVETMHLPQLLDMTRKQKLIFLNSFDEVLINCDGVIWMYWGPVPNAFYAIILFEKMKKPVRFLSNNSLRSEEEYIQKFKALGIESIRPMDIILPVKTMIGYLKTTQPGKPVFSLCGSAINGILQRNGIKIKTMTPILDLTLENLASKMAIDDKVGAVLMDVNFNISISELIRAQQYLEDPDCSLVVGASHNVIKLTDEIKTIGPGGFVNLLKESSGKDPVLLGKGNVLNDEITKQFHVKKPARYLFIGESIDHDIMFGKRCGFQTLLVLMEPSRAEELKKTRPQDRPDFVIEKLSDFVDFMADLN